MTLQHAFDRYAGEYDRDFTHSAIGRAQRRQVWKALLPYLSEKPDILEINCGTGADALQLSRHGCKVLATDISREMIRQAENKLMQAGETKATFLQAGFLELADKLPDRQFDLVFSNFGGLNCLSPEDTPKLARAFCQLVKPGGRLFLVYMSRHCLWENLYFRWKGETKAARRRHGGYAEAVIGDQKIEVWYYTPGELRGLFAPFFRVSAVRPVGLFTPPSYMEAWMARKPVLLKILEQADRLTPFKWLSDLADHFILVLEKMPEPIS